MLRNLIYLILVLTTFDLSGQTEGLKTKRKKYKTENGLTVEGEVGFLTVPENYDNPASRKIKVKFIRLKSTSANPEAPIVYLEGGGKACTWQAEDPEYLNDWLPILKVSDLIFVDQRGTNDNKLFYLGEKQLPIDFFTTEESVSNHYQNLVQKALPDFRKRKIDIEGYNIVAHAKDVHNITEGLGINKYSIFGFSYGTGIGMALMKLYESSIVNAVFVGTDGLDQSFNYPSHLDSHFDKIVQLAKQDEAISATIPDLKILLEEVMDKLSLEPARITVKNPITRKEQEIEIGPYGLAILLRMDLDDTNDIPAIPRLLYTISQGDYSMLTWFAEKRVPFGIAVPGNGLNQAIASGASDERWRQIDDEAEQSIFGNAVNFPFYEAKRVWPKRALAIDTHKAINSEIRTLFISGDLDARTPVTQANEIMKGFENSTHLIVKNAGHEQAMWDIEIFDEAIPQFFQGLDVSHIKASFKAIQFIPLIGPSSKHPSIR